MSAPDVWAQARPVDAGVDAGLDMAPPLPSPPSVPADHIQTRLLPPFVEGPQPLLDAREHIVRGRRGAARELLRKWLLGHDAHPLAWSAALMLGTIEGRDGAHSKAASHFAKAAHGDHPLKDFARFRAAQSAASAGQHKDAIEWASKVDARGRFAQRARALSARLMARRAMPGAEVALDRAIAGSKGAQLRHLRVLRAQLAERRKDWPLAAKLHRDNSLRFAHHADGKAAAKRLRQLRWKMPHATWRALDASKAVDAQLEKARGELFRHRNQALLETSTALLASDQLVDADRCEALWLKARALSKLRARGDAAIAYAEFIGACGDDPRALDAAFARGKGLFTADANDAAITALAVFDTHPEGPLADDALYITARIHAQAGRPKAAAAALDRLLTARPYGDMAANAHWMLYRMGLRRGTIEQADAAEADRYTRGRMAYFRARDAARAGETQAAIAGYLAVTRRAPMGYYALLAVNRLMVLAPETVEGALTAQIAAYVAVEPPEAHDLPAFEEGADLLSLGLGVDAWSAFASAEDQLARPDGYRRSVLGLYDQAGLHTMADRIAARSLTHYEGAWPSAEPHRYDALYPRRYARYIKRWSTARQIPEALVYAIIREESRFDRRVESWANACGLMQLRVATARDLAIADGAGKRMSCRRLSNAYLNIRLGSLYLKDLGERYGTHPGLIVAGYHAGYGNMKRFLRELQTDEFDLFVESIPFVQTRRYIKRVLPAMWVYRWLLAEEDASAASRVLPVALAFRKKAVESSPAQ